MKTVFKSCFFAACAAGFLLSPDAARACSVCMGGSDSIVAPAMNGAIFLMLGFVALMLSSAGGFIFYLARRAARNPLPGHPDFGGGLSSIKEGK